MKVKFLIISLLFTTILATNSFSYKWVRQGADYYIQDDNSAICKTNELINENGLVYYFDDDGKMCTGWYYKPSNGKVYFFNNNPLQTFLYGTMVFGLKTIDGYKRYFDISGELVRAEKDGEFVKAIDNYVADYRGNLYLNNVLQFDNGPNKSDYYTDINFYTTPELNNQHLSFTRIITWENVKENRKLTNPILGPR